MSANECWLQIGADESSQSERRGRGLLRVCIAVLIAVAMPGVALAKKGVCDNDLAQAFKNDPETTVLLVKKFVAGSPVVISETPGPNTPVAAVNICMVKLLIGPGNPGPAGAPSTSAGIGIEVWLPDSWNERIRDVGSGGWAGGVHSDPTRVGSRAVAITGANQGFAGGTSDHGHVLSNGSFAMNPDGSINRVLWQDFAERSMLELSHKTKALVKEYYGKKQKYAYWDGFSTGGRQGYKLAQKYPKEYDGILAGAPAFNWSRFITAELYPQIVMQRDLGTVIPLTKLNAVSTAAVAACGGTERGFLLDPLQCRYDPTRDATALCAGAVGNGVVGTNGDATKCVSHAEALAINKIWYSQTTDGSVPDPLRDNGSGRWLGGRHLWYGLTRGTTLGSLAGTPPFAIATDQVALELQDPTIAQPSFTNATGNGANGWKNLTYSGLADAFAKGIALQPAFSNINTDNPDLRGVRRSKGKVLTYHGLADNLIMPMGSINYFWRVVDEMGGLREVQKFNRLILIPGLAHDGSFSRSGSFDPTTGTTTSANKVPLPQPVGGRDELFVALQKWVENGKAPRRIEVSSADASVAMPLCIYPKQAIYVGFGSTKAASSYLCERPRDGRGHDEHDHDQDDDHDDHAGGRH